MRKIIATIIFTAMLIPLAVIIIKGRKREYDCLTPEEVDKSYPQYSVFTTDYSWT